MCLFDSTECSYLKMSCKIRGSFFEPDMKAPQSLHFTLKFPSTAVGTSK